MKKCFVFFITTLTLISTSVIASDWNVFVGPHFFYTNFSFTNPNDLKGYEGGVTVGANTTCSWFFAEAHFEGSWNAGPITGTPCQRSSLSEYFVEGKVGGNFCFCRETLKFQPYTGFGWDRLKNTQDPNTAQLTFRFDKLFVPLGFFTSWFYSEYSSFGLQFEWRPDVTSCLHLLDIDLNSKCEQGFRGELSWNYYHCCPCYGFWIDVIPFFDWTEYGSVTEKNSVGATLSIPALKKWDLGLRLLFGWKF